MSKKDMNFVNRFSWQQTWDHLEQKKKSSAMPDRGARTQAR
jgi:hypothetical protein